MMKAQNVAAIEPKQEKYHSYKMQRRIGTILSYVLLVCLAVIWLYPLLWIIICSFTQAADGTPTIMPSQYFPHGSKYSFGFQNYINLIKGNTEVFGVYQGAKFTFYFPKWFWNTFWVACVSCVISTTFTLMVAYVMSKLKFSFRKTYLNIAMIIGLFPGFMSMIAIYFILKTMGLTGSLWALVLCYSSGAGTGFYVAKGFFDVIPDALIESSRLDGASNAQIFRHIILPMSKPIIIYQALMAFTGPWMDFIFAKVILGEDNPESWIVSVGLYNSLFGAQPDTSIFTVFAAGCVCVAIPIVTLFMFLQKYYVEGVTAGSVK